jgi:hypothetical protein
LGELAGQVSGVGRDAGISENYALICNRLMKQKSAIGSARRACCEILDFCTEPADVQHHGRLREAKS